MIHVHIQLCIFGESLLRRILDLFTRLLFFFSLLSSTYTLLPLLAVITYLVHIMLLRLLMMSLVRVGWLLVLRLNELRILFSLYLRLLTLLHCMNSARGLGGLGLVLRLRE